jgi:cell cycle protein kinase DBF2
MSRSPKKQISGLPPTGDLYHNARMSNAKIPTFGTDKDTARGGTGVRGQNMKMWERELLDSPEVRRKSTVAQLCVSFYTFLHDHD